jgi:hypothetical protein
VPHQCEADHAPRTADQFQEHSRCPLALQRIREEVEAALDHAALEETAEWEPLLRDAEPRRPKQKLADFTRVTPLALEPGNSTDAAGPLPLTMFPSEARS